MLIRLQGQIKEFGMIDRLDNGPIFDKEALEKVHPNDDYNVFTIERQHPQQPESINNTYFLEKDDSNITPDSLDMCNDEGKVDQDTT
ncbi:hypothetical protein Tco_1115539 [Tanacetum coccineum]